MQIRLLGTAAGGGVPQWNCNCPMCREARLPNGRVRPRTQSSVALTADGKRWFLLNASPDLRLQIESFEELHPAGTSTRGSPIDSVLLTNADLDHTAGLLFLREGQPLIIHAPAQVRAALIEGFALGPVLDQFCGVHWIEPPPTISPLPCRDGSSSGLSYQAIALPGSAPKFFGKASTQLAGNVVAYYIVDSRTGGRLLYAPQVGNRDCIALLPKCDLLLFDGTFWSENEMVQYGPRTSSATAMGHIPISGEGGGSLPDISELAAMHKVYVHINNTNPILREDSAERKAVSSAGCIVGADGMQFSI